MNTALKTFHWKITSITEQFAPKRYPHNKVSKYPEWSKNEIKNLKPRKIGTLDINKEPKYVGTA